MFAESVQDSGRKHDTGDQAYLGHGNLGQAGKSLGTFGCCDCVGREKLESTAFASGHGEPWRG